MAHTMGSVSNQVVRNIDTVRPEYFGKLSTGSVEGRVRKFAWFDRLTTNGLIRLEGGQLTLLRSLSALTETEPSAYDYSNTCTGELLSTRICYDRL